MKRASTTTSTAPTDARYRFLAIKTSKAGTNLTPRCQYTYGSLVFVMGVTWLQFRLLLAGRAEERELPVMQTVARALKGGGMSSLIEECRAEAPEVASVMATGIAQAVKGGALVDTNGTTVPIAGRADYEAIARDAEAAIALDPTVHRYCLDQSDDI